MPFPYHFLMCINENVSPCAAKNVLVLPIQQHQPQAPQTALSHNIVPRLAPSANFLPSVLIAALPPATSSFLLRAAIVFLRVAQFIRGLPRPFNDVKYSTEYECLDGHRENQLQNGVLSRSQSRFSPAVRLPGPEGRRARVG